jgi:hypothetical protein
MLVGVITLGIAQSALADVKGTENFYAWDRNLLTFRNSTADIFFDGSPVEVFSQLSFDSDLYTTVADDASSCGVGASTQYAGRVTLRFDHTDANPAGALGMKESQAWQLVNCDFDGNGTINAADRNVDLGANPPIEYTTGELTLIEIDEVVAAGGAVQTEIVTTMFVNIDSDCDNSVADEPLPTGGVVCFFAQGVTPTIAEAGPPYWNNANLQAAFGGSSGDKTVNLKPFGPTAITLENLAAQSAGGVHPAVWLAIFILVAAIAFVLIREGRKGDFLTIRKDE